jgi:hypothetical protein
MAAMVSPSRQQQISPLSSKPYKKSGGNKDMAFMQSMFEAYAKSPKKASKSKKRKKCAYNSSDSSNSE